MERDTSAAAVVEEVARVVLVMSYRRRATMAKDPEPPLGESAEVAGFIVHGPELVVSSLEVDRLPVKRRTEAMARFALPLETEPRRKWLLAADVQPLTAGA